MPTISPETHAIKYKINKNIEMSLLERKMFRCMAKIKERKPRSSMYAYIHNKDFGVDDKGGVTRAQSINQGLIWRNLSINSKYVVGKRSKGYRLTRKGEAELEKVLSLRLKEEPIINKGPKVTDKNELQKIHRKNLKSLTLSKEFYFKRLKSKYNIESFFRAYRTSKSGGCRIIVDDYDRVHYPITNIKKEFRKYLSFYGPKGMPLAEVDIKCSNPVMMLKADLVHESEKHKWGELILTNRFYETLSNTNTARVHSKRYINAVLNGSRRRTRSRMEDIFPETMRKVTKRTGLELMRTESSVMNPIILELDNMGIQCLRLHDAILCDPEHVDDVVSLFNKFGLPTDHSKVPFDDLVKHLI